MKQEPSLGNLFGLFKPEKFIIDNNHEDLVSDALDAFTKAEAKMDSAIIKIEASIVAQEAEVAKVQGQILAANESKDKLSRVLDRVRALTA